MSSSEEKAGCLETGVDGVVIVATRTLTVDLSRIVKMYAESGLSAPMREFYFSKTLGNLKLSNEMMISDEKGKRKFNAWITSIGNSAAAAFTDVPEAAFKDAACILSVLANGLEAEYEEASSLPSVNCTFVQVFDGGKLASAPATFDPANGEVQVDSIDLVFPDLEGLYIEFEDHTRYEVCQNCNSHILDYNGWCTDLDCHYSRKTSQAKETR